MRHFPLRELGWAIAVIVVPMALYAGAYFATVERVVVNDWTKPETVRFWGPKHTVARYRVAQEWSAAIFGPMHQLDRKMRPEFWAGE
jgi:hypothetical protein